MRLSIDEPTSSQGNNVSRTWHQQQLGSSENLELIRNAGVKCPLLCKEFIIDAWQFYYDRSKGADAVLLIAAVLPDLDIKYMVKICKLLGLAALVEMHDEREFDRVLGIESVELIGINNLQSDIALQRNYQIVARHVKLSFYAGQNSKPFQDAAVIRVILLNCEPAEQQLTTLKNYDRRKISKSNSVTTSFTATVVDARFDSDSFIIQLLSKDEKYCKGSFENLELIRNAGVKCPLLCKEFIIDAWQFYYDRSKGADAVLLIVAVLPDLDIKYMVKVCKLLGLAALVEMHDEREFDRVLGIESVELIGINNLQSDIALQRNYQIVARHVKLSFYAGQNSKPFQDAAVIRVILLNCEPAEQQLTTLKNYDRRKISKSNSVTTSFTATVVDARFDSDSFIIQLLSKDEKYCKGSSENLELIRNAGVKCPLLCKEFIIDVWQFYYDRSKGANAVLLIVVVLPDLDIKYMVKVCKLLGLAALVEMHDEREFDRVLGIESVELIGINNLQSDIALQRNYQIVARHVKLSFYAGQNSKPFQDAAVIRVILLNCEPAEQQLTTLKNYDRRKISKSNSVTTSFTATVVDARFDSNSFMIQLLSKDEKYCKGSSENLELIRNAGVKCPLLCKEFIIDAWKFYYDRSKGADAVLLIVAVLPDLDIKYMVKVCKLLGLAALVEMHDEREFDRVLGIESVELIGINNLQSDIALQRNYQIVARHVKLSFYAGQNSKPFQDAAVIRVILLNCEPAEQQLTTLKNYDRRKISKSNSVTTSFTATVVDARFDSDSFIIQLLSKDEKYCKGSSENLELIRNAGVKCPLLCKEFIIDAWQFYYDRSKGADAVLLIVAVLPDLDIKYMVKVCKLLGLAALVEMHDEREFDRVLGIESVELIGINNLQSDIANSKPFQDAAVIRVILLNCEPAEQQLTGLKNYDRRKISKSNSVTTRNIFNSPACITVQIKSPQAKQTCPIVCFEESDPANQRHES
ncbi:hypothetical protein KIW84_072543 [Lathyrus oleraceus]|uniref:indole-3-glycerol-phosphate synthase n=1 Tax=Pisum sativum TaxID=3888 RepID=A0A9D4ZXL3_PEA|nr:hypothetical protein KIW84_072543 [Pisum sativum]